MMRVVMTFFWGLLATWLITEELVAQAPSRPGAPKIVKNGAVLTVTGYGLDTEAAQRDAVKEAQKELRKDLRKRNFAHWIPSEAFIRKNLIADPGAEGEEVQVKDGEPAKTWILQVKQPSSSDASRMDAIAKQYVERQLRNAAISPRLALLTKGLAAILVFLVALLGYLRLEEKTQGIYTHLLRVGMICLVAGAGAGILFWS